MPDRMDSAQKYPESNHTLLLLNVLRGIWKKRFFIAGFIVVTGVLGIIYSFRCPITYLAQTIIIPPASEHNFSNLSIGKDLPFDLSSTLFGSINNDKEITERYALILMSDRLRIGVIDSFNLARRYKIDRKGKKYFIEDVLAALKNKAQVFAEKGTVLIWVFDSSPSVAAAMANFMVFMLDSINKDITRTQLGRKKEFLYSRMMENRDSLTLYENMLVAFQKKHGIIDIQRQAEASVAAVAQTETDIFFRELQLSLEESKFSPNAVGIFERNNDIRALREKLLKMNKNKDNTLIMPIKRIPEEALTLARLQRATTVSDMLDRFLTKAYEEARLEEKSTIPTIAVIDPARTPQKRFAPKRKRIVLIFMGVGLGLGMIIATMLDSIGPYTKDYYRQKAT